MALFKIFGNFASGNTTLPTSTTQGYCYFDKNTGKFYIDTATSETAELGTNRLALNADKADKDGAGNSIINTYLTKANGLTNVSLNTSTRKLQKTINGTTSDITQLGLIPGTGENSVIGGGTSSDISTATGKCAMAYGRNASASGNYSFAFGYNTQAKGLYSVAMGGTVSGQDTIAIGAASLAVGGGVQTGNSTDAGNASGNYAVAVGYHSKAIGNISFASGYGTISKGQSAASFGAWNLIDNTVTTDNAKGTYAFAVGNGTADDARSNALTVDWSGNTTIAGSLATSNIYLSGITNISNNGIDVDPAFIGWNDNYLKLRFNDEESNSIELGNNGLIINDGTGVGNNGQALLSDGTKAYWGNISTEDTKVNVSTRGTTKAYLLADTTAPTSTAAAHTAVAESDVYLDTTAGALAATTYKIAEAVTLQYNSTTQALDFIFA